MWRAPACGSYNLGNFNPPINDKLSSVDNNSASTITLYNWTGSWTVVATVPPYTAVNAPWWNDTVDGVYISC
jgi:hypothetical protein